MGYGSYTASDWTKLKASRGLNAASSANQTFHRSNISEKLDSRFIGIRESYDSEDSPESTPIIMGFDVTGSMGYLANEIATNSLNETIMQILTKKPVTDPHMMCAAFTDCNHPLQATQFEADIRVVEQLLDFKLGGGNRYGYDTILWYFAAKHTKIDSLSKRGKKGILIGIGDEVCGGEENNLTPREIEALFQDSERNTLTFSKLLKMAREKYDVIHIVVGSDYRVNGASYAGWKEHMPGCVAKLHEKNISCLADVVVAIIQLLNGVDRETILKEYSGEKAEIIREAICDIRDTGAKKGKEKNFFKRIFG